ncbi:MAG: PleD family two-component system response regulator [Kofleriaceae bacterium]
MSAVVRAPMRSANGSSGHVRQAISVLVVDDDPDIRETISEVLEDEGYSVVSAVNGADALDVLQSIKPSLILLDLSMPIMSGQEFRCRQLADPALAAIPTVVMTAADRIYDKTAGLKLTAILPKPITLQTLLASVERYQH